MTTGDVGGRPDALLDLDRFGRALDDELVDAARRAGAALEAFLATRPETPVPADTALPATALSVAAAWRDLDDLARRTGSGLAVADAGTLDRPVTPATFDPASGLARLPGVPAGYVPGSRLDGVVDDLAEEVREVGLLSREAGRIVREVLEEASAEVAERLRQAVDAGGAPASELVGFLAGDIANLWRGADDSMPWGAWLAGSVRTWRVARYVTSSLQGVVGKANPLPLFNNGLAGRQLLRFQSMTWLGTPAATATLRGAGIAGGLYTGVTGTVDLVAQGNPVDAYRREGAGYVADAAGTAFGYSSAAFLVAPSPMTGAAAVGSGVVWLGAEAWDHRGEIVEVWDGATDWAGDRLDDAAGIVSDVGGAAVQGVGGIADAVSFWN